jgi:predicted nucleic acid-binding protein
MIYVLDASALLRFTDKEPGFRRVRDLFYQAAKGDIQLLLSAVNWGEIVAVICKRHDPTGARDILGNLSSLPMTIMPVDAKAAESAGLFKHRFKIPYADAFAGSLTLGLSVGSPQNQTTLITADFDFKGVSEDTIKIEFLSTK